MSDFLPSGEPIADVDAWLRVYLSRRLIVAIISPGREEVASERIQILARALAAYAEIGVVKLAPDAAFLPRMLDALCSLDPEIVLVVDVAGEEPSSPPDADERERRLRALLDGLERAGILDRAFVALIGPQVTRTEARRLGYEDGFLTTIPQAELASILAREGVAVDERRRRGSSPPCYL